MFVLLAIVITLAAGAFILAINARVAKNSAHVDTLAQQYTMPSAQYANYTASDHDAVWGGRYAN
jgi:hypothetical protein